MSSRQDECALLVGKLQSMSQSPGKPAQESTYLSSTAVADKHELEGGSA